jgi:hypothetical protein
MPLRVARDGPHVFAVLALEPEQIAFGVGRRKRRTLVAVAFRAMLPAVVVRRGLGMGHRGADSNYGSASFGESSAFSAAIRPILAGVWRDDDNAARDARNVHVRAAGARRRAEGIALTWTLPSGYLKGGPGVLRRNVGILYDPYLFLDLNCQSLDLDSEPDNGAEMWGADQVGIAYRWTSQRYQSATPLDPDELLGLQSLTEINPVGTQGAACRLQNSDGTHHERVA